MRNSKTKREMVPMYAAKDYFARKKNAKPAGWMNNQAVAGQVFVDRATLERLIGKGSRRNG